MSRRTSSGRIARGRGPTPAFAAMVAAVIIALGGGAIAAEPGAERSAKSLKRSKVKRIAVNQAVKQIELLAPELTVAKAGSANSANSANQAANASKFGGLPPAAYKLKCPNGMSLAAGLCYEHNERPAETYFQAADICAVLGRRLPSASEFRSGVVGGAIATAPSRVGDIVMTSNLYYDEGAHRHIAVDHDGNLIYGSDLSVPFPFHCVVAPSN